jgi:hypothetical protein
MMDMITRLPEMSDDALANLRTNAKRLEHSGNAGQRSDAATRRLAKVKATRTASAKDPTRSGRPVKRATDEPGTR